MATMKDLDRLALAMPGTTKEMSEDGRPGYSVHGKMFCIHRSKRRDAVDAQTGERLDDVLLFRVGGPEEKELQLADPRGIFFTTPRCSARISFCIFIASSTIKGCPGSTAAPSSTRTETTRPGM